MYSEDAGFGVVDRTSSRVARERENVLDLCVQGKIAAVIEIDHAALIIKPPVSRVFACDLPNHAAYRARWAPQLAKQARGVANYQRVGIHYQLLRSEERRVGKE